MCLRGTSWTEHSIVKTTAFSPHQTAQSEQWCHYILKMSWRSHKGISTEAISSWPLRCRDYFLHNLVSVSLAFCVAWMGKPLPMLWQSVKWRADSADVRAADCLGTNGSHPEASPQMNPYYAKESLSTEVHAWLCDHSAKTISTRQRLFKIDLQISIHCVLFTEEDCEMLWTAATTQEWRAWGEIILSH